MKINFEKGNGNSLVCRKQNNISKKIITRPRNWATSIGWVRKYTEHFEVGLIGQLIIQ